MIKNIDYKIIDYIGKFSVAKFTNGMYDPIDYDNINKISCSLGNVTMSGPSYDFISKHIRLRTVYKFSYKSHTIHRISIITGRKKDSYYNIAILLFDAEDETIYTKVIKVDCSYYTISEWYKYIIHNINDFIYD